MSALRRTALALTLLPLTHAAWAADATPDQARALERQLRDWMTSMVGPALPMPDRPVQLTPEGDHYAVSVPLGSGASPPTLTGSARMLDGGKWSIDSIKFPSPAEITVMLPGPPKDGEKTPGPPTPVTYKVTLGQQSTQVLYDPSFATISTLNSTIQGVDVQASGAAMQQTTHADRSTTTSTMRPVGTDRVDLQTDSTVEGYTINAKIADAEPIAITMQRVRLSGQINAVSRDRATQITQALAKVSAALMASKPGVPSGPPLDPAAARELLRALADLSSGMTFDETIEKLSVNYGGMGGTVNQARIGFTGKTVDGIVQAAMDLGVEGLALPDLPLGDMAVLIPAKIAIRPFVTGIAIRDLLRLADNSAPGQPPSPQDIQSLFSHGGITTGLESFNIDVAGSNFTGNGKLVFTAPERFAGTAQITASNLDLLQQRVAAIPALAQAVPVFIFAKGIGRTVDNRIVWDITYRDGRVVVNGQDLTQMTGASPPPPGGQNRQGQGQNQGQGRQIQPNRPPQRQ